MPKKIDPALRERAVRLVREHRGEYPSNAKAMAAVARKEGVGAESLAGGCCKPTSTRVTGRGRPAKNMPRSRRLKVENKRLREDVAILRAATTFFAGELDPRNR